MRMKTKNTLALLVVMSMVILMAGCINDPNKPAAGESAGKFETSSAEESFQTEDGSGNADFGTEDTENAQTEHADGEVYMVNEEKTIYVSNLEHCADWLGKTAAEAGVPNDFAGELWVRVEGKIFGFQAYGHVYRSGRSEEDRFTEVNLFLSNETVKPSELYEILVISCGQPYETSMEPYVAANGGSVSTDVFWTGRYSIALSSAELRTFSELTLTLQSPEEKEPTPGELLLQEIREATGYDLVLPEDTYHHLDGGKMGGTELNWYYLNFELDGGLKCTVDLAKNVTEKQAAEEIFLFAEGMEDKIVSEDGYSMLLDETSHTGWIYWVNMNTAWAISIQAEEGQSVIDYDLLRQARLEMIAAYEREE